jgi:hypothetical protein
MKKTYPQRLLDVQSMVARKLNWKSRLGDLG